MPNCRVLESGICSITQPYHINGQKGYNYDHWGIDLTDFNGSYNILGWEVAHSDGTVIATRNDCYGWEDNSYGNYVLIQHDNGYQTLYAHIAQGTVQVWAGQRVKEGQRVGYMGNTGTSYGGHLHFEIRQPDGYQIDPEPYLNADLPNSGGGDIAVDGVWGIATTTKAQQVYGTFVDGIVSGQHISTKKFCPACLDDTFEWCDGYAGGSDMIRKMQWALRIKEDGLFGVETIKKLQVVLHIPVDGYCGNQTVSAFQKWLNEQ